MIFPALIAACTELKLGKDAGIDVGIFGVGVGTGLKGDWVDIWINGTVVSVKPFLLKNYPRS